MRLVESVSNYANVEIIRTSTTPKFETFPIMVMMTSLVFVILIPRINILESGVRCQKIRSVYEYHTLS